MSFGSHRPRKRFGQHWLMDGQVLDRIVAAADIAAGEWLLEVGPGRGALTERLLATDAAGVVAVELDRDLAAGLRHRFAGEPRLHLVEGDVLSVPLLTPERTTPDKVVANIPYNITGPLLERLVGRLERPVAQPFRRLVLLVQQEVGQRLTASAGDTAFSALTVRMALLARCSRVCAVPPRCFQPPPKVMSEVVVLEPLPAESWLEPARAQRLERLLRGCFSARRKMLRNSLAGVAPAGRLEALAAEAEVDLSLRPQDLPVERWLALERAVAQHEQPTPGEAHQEAEPKANPAAELPLAGRDGSGPSAVATQDGVDPPASER